MIGQAEADRGPTTACSAEDRPKDASPPERPRLMLPNDPETDILQAPF